MKKPVPEDAILIPDDAECVYHGVVFDVYNWPQRLFDGSQQPFEMLRRPDTVVAVCVVDGRIVILDDEQPHRGMRRGFPGGRADPDDASTLAAAQREVHEETGYSFRKWRLVQVYQPVAKMEWFEYIYLAWDTDGQDAPHADPGEKITVSLLPFDEVRQLCLQRDDHMGDAAALFEAAQSLDALLAIPPFQGKEIER